MCCLVRDTRILTLFSDNIEDDKHSFNDGQKTKFRHKPSPQLSYIYNPKLLDNTSPHSTKPHSRTINSHCLPSPQTPVTTENLGKEHQNTFLIYANQPLICPHNHKQTQPQFKTTMRSNSNKVKLPYTHPTP